MKRTLSVIFSAALALCLFLGMGTAVSAAGYPDFYVGNTNVTATAETTTYWLKDSATNPTTEFTQTGASADNYTFSVTYDALDGYTLTSNGAVINTYSSFESGGNTYRGGMICQTALDIVVGANGMNVTNATGGVYGIFTDGDINITGTGNVTVNTPYIAINNKLNCDVNGTVAISTSGTAPTITGNATITAGGDIILTSTNVSGSLVVVGKAILTSEGGNVTLSSASAAPTVGGSLTIAADDDINIQNTGGTIVSSSTATVLTSASGNVTLNGISTAPLIASPLTVNANQNISIENTGTSMAISGEANLTSTNGKATVKSVGGPTIGGVTTVSAHGDILIENTGNGMATANLTTLTSTHGKVTVKSKTGGPTIGGTATMSAYGDILVENTGDNSAISARADLTSTNGKVTVIGKASSNAVIIGPSSIDSDPTVIRAKGDVAITCTTGGYCVSGNAALTSTDGTVTVACNASAPAITGYANITAKGDVQLANDSYMACVFYAKITSQGGAVTVIGSTPGAAVIGTYADISALDDITIANHGSSGFCVGSSAKLTSNQGKINLSCTSSAPAIEDDGNLSAFGDITIQNEGIGMCLNGESSLISKSGNIRVSSSGNYAVAAPVTVKLNARGKTATFIGTLAATPSSFVPDMFLYKVYGGTDEANLTEISLAAASTHPCVQFQNQFAVEAGSTNLGSFVDNGDNSYTVTAAGDLVYEQGSASSKGAYLGVYFNGLTGVNGEDYFLSYGDSDSVTWNTDKAITSNTGESSPSLYVNLLKGERTLYVYLDTDGAGTDDTGTVFTVNYEIPDGATYTDGTHVFTWTGSAWLNNNPFQDVSAGQWYYNDVMFAYEHGLMVGTGNDEFSPATMTTRAALVTILWRVEGKPSATQAVTFKDIPAKAYYTEAVAWAAEIGIVSGYNANEFGPGDVITREQFATILYRYAEYKKYNVTGTTDLAAFTDVGNISDYALTAVKWANANGLMVGTSATTIAPLCGTTRAQAAALIHRFISAFMLVG